MRYPKRIYLNVRSIHGRGIQSVPGTAQTDGSVATECVEGSCGDSCGDKGAGGELHCMVERCQPSPLHSFPQEKFALS